MITNDSTLNNKDSKIFVAGGTGLVGSAIVKNLIDKGYTNIITAYHKRQQGTCRAYKNYSGLQR